VRGDFAPATRSAFFVEAFGPAGNAGSAWSEMACERSFAGSQIEVVAMASGNATESRLSNRVSGVSMTWDRQGAYHSSGSWRWRSGR
jgi:hypothetical protein